MSAAALSLTCRLRLRLPPLLQRLHTSALSTGSAHVPHATGHAMAAPPARRALVPCADGTEDLELAAIVDVLRRAGVDVVVAAAGAATRVTLARGLVIEADTTVVAAAADAAQRPFDAIVLPGGMPGATHLRDSSKLTAELKALCRRGGLIAAICASPAVVLAHHDLLKGCTRATAFPSFCDAMAKDLKRHGATACAVIDAANEAVVVSGGLGHGGQASHASFITSRGPGTAIEFALQVAAHLQGAATAEKVGRGLLADEALIARVVAACV